jgi:hypothetical protein
MTLRSLYNALLRNAFFQFIIPLFALSGLFLMVTPASWYPAWFFPRMTGIGGLIYAAALLGSNFLFPINRNDDVHTLEHKHRALTRLQNYFAVGLLLSYIGTLGLYQIDSPYDKFLHFFFPFLAVIALSRFILHWWNIPLPIAIKRTVILVATGSLVWEGMEYISDIIFDTTAFGDNTGSVVLDTLLDGSLDTLGIVLGVLAVKLRKKPFPY